MLHESMIWRWLKDGSCYLFYNIRYLFYFKSTLTYKAQRSNNYQETSFISKMGGCLETNSRSCFLVCKRKACLRKETVSPKWWMCIKRSLFSTRLINKAVLWTFIISNCCLLSCRWIDRKWFHFSSESECSGSHWICSETQSSEGAKRTPCSCIKRDKTVVVS